MKTRRLELSLMVGSISREKLAVSPQDLASSIYGQLVKFDLFEIVQHDNISMMVRAGFIGDESDVKYDRESR